MATSAKSWIIRFYSNHVLANLMFALVLVVGFLSFMQMPREQDPEINFNWIDISTVVPGMAAEDVEKRVTDILEDAIIKVSDIKFVSSNSRENFSHILVRFNDISPRQFDKRLNDLRREITSAEDELPGEAESPFVFEITTANAFPMATVIITGPARDENLRKQAVALRKDIDRIKGVDRTLVMGMDDPELHIDFDPAQLEAIGIPPQVIANTVSLYYRDLSAGQVEVGERIWLVRMTGTNADPAYLASLPLAGTDGEIRLGSVADVSRSHEKSRYLVNYRNQPAVMVSVTKKAGVNTLDLVQRVNDFVNDRNRFSDLTGVRLVLADDQTEITRNALEIMQNNAMLGLIMVLFVTWIFLGSKIALLTSVGIPFILAGTFWILQGAGHTLNVSILLGVVISLGMLVDDAVVVVESIYYRLQRGMDAMQAVMESVAEVFAPVTAAVLTTMAAFLPLMLLPGILGKFMRVIPLVVTISLAISLIEAYWMLPAHIHGARIRFDNPGRIQRWRERFLHTLRLRYVKLLTKAMRIPKTLIISMVFLFLLAVFAAFAGQVNPQLMHHPVIKNFLVKTDFFASDTLRLFYINIEMPNGTPLVNTLEKVSEIEVQARKHVDDTETRSIVTYAGQMFTEIAPFQGTHYGQILISLAPKSDDSRTVEAIIESMRKDVMSISGPTKIYFLRLTGGPPTAKAISVKVRGDRIDELRAAAGELKQFLRQSGWAEDITDDDSPGVKEMVLKLNLDNLQSTGITPDQAMRAMRLLVDGEIVAQLRDEGETVYVRVKSKNDHLDNIETLLAQELPAPDGSMVPISRLLQPTLQQGLGNIRHYNFRRTITVEADIDKDKTDTITANNAIREAWKSLQPRYPNISLDFSGELDDIEEALGSIGKLMLFGILLMYLILGTQFRSYYQPLLILVTVPMAFTGVVIGLLVTGNPLSLYTLYGVVALAGIAVNAAIVLISAANSRLEQGMSVLHATLYAARRRVVPILITSMTTIAGLFSLATGLGGKSLLWGPVATAIVWGLLVSTVLTLFVVPLLYRLSMKRSHLNTARNLSDLTPFGYKSLDDD
jgi:multidrug efflux pump subunit AcrB